MLRVLSGRCLPRSCWSLIRRPTRHPLQWREDDSVSFAVRYRAGSLLHPRGERARRNPLPQVGGGMLIISARFF